MAEKNDVSVLINGKIYKLSGYESSEYLQKVATYINEKIAECKSSEHYRKLSAEYQGVLLALNIADDYFKVKKQAEEAGKVEGEKDKQVYDLRHEVIETRIKHESALKLVEEYKEQVNALQRKIIQLEAEQNRKTDKP
ncbi:MAG: cell division protein ZapA [Lachnospiraceae bacterium]|nr:cell division protein ZapA [Lachnospiraceae bacterium]